MLSLSSFKYKFKNIISVTNKAIRRHTYSFIFLLVITLSCKNKIKVPNDILSEPKMALVMADLIIAEDIVRIKNLPSDTSSKLYHGFYKPEVLKKHDISLALFDSSISFYLDNPELFHTVTLIQKDTLLKRKERFSVEKQN